MVDAPDVGENSIDHPSTYFYYNVRNPSEGWSVGSDNPVFEDPQFRLGMNIQLLVSGGVPRAGLIEAITADEDGVAPDPTTYPLLRSNRTFTEFAIQQGGAADGSKMIFGAFAMMPTSRGTVRLASANIGENPTAYGFTEPMEVGSSDDHDYLDERIRATIGFVSHLECRFGTEHQSPSSPLLLAIYCTEQLTDPLQYA